MPRLRFLRHRSWTSRGRQGHAAAVFGWAGFCIQGQGSCSFGAHPGLLEGPHNQRIRHGQSGRAAGVSSPCCRTGPRCSSCTRRAAPCELLSAGRASKRISLVSISMRLFIFQCVLVPPLSLSAMLYCCCRCGTGAAPQFGYHLPPFNSVGAPASPLFRPSFPPLVEGGEVHRIPANGLHFSG